MDCKTKEKVSSEVKRSEEAEFKFKNEPIDEDLKNIVIEIYTAHANKCDLPGLAENIKKDLDAKRPKGWIVFAGKHMVGACSYIENTLLDFEINGNSFVIFQTHCPE